MMFADIRQSLLRLKAVLRLDVSFRSHRVTDEEHDT